MLLILLLLLVQKDVRYQNIIIVHFRVAKSKKKQLLVFPFLRKQVHPVNTMMTYTVHVYYSKYKTPDVEHFEMANNYGYGKRCLTKEKILLFLFLIRQSKPVIYNDDIYCIIYYRKHGASDKKIF